MRTAGSLALLFLALGLSLTGCKSRDRKEPDDRPGGGL